MKRARAFTLIEVLVAVVLVGIMAGVAASLIRDHSDEARAAADDTNVGILQNRIDAYRATKGQYPASLDELLDSDPPYLRSIPGGSDAWVYAADTGLISRAQ